MRCWLQFLVMVWLLSGVASADAKPPMSMPTDLHGDPLPAGALARMGSVRLRAALDSAVWPNGEVISLGEDRKVRIWDLATGKEFRRMGESIKVLSPDGKLAAGLNWIDA